jgi:hypothetical protein
MQSPVTPLEEDFSPDLETFERLGVLSAEPQGC